MANIQFKLQKSIKEKKPIAVRFKVGRKIDITANTGFIISDKDWTDKNLPKKNNDANKRLHKSMLRLQSYLEDRYNEVLTTSTIIDKYWLINQINTCFERVEKKDAGLVVNHIQYIIDNANTRKVAGRNQIGITKSRVKGYETFKKVIQEYERVIKKQVHFLEINKGFIEKFTNWLINTKKYSKNYAGKQIDNLKTVCLDAEKLDIPVNTYCKQIESFKETNDERYIVTLSFTELEKIRTAELTKEAHINARKWILIGCEIGQRASDLLNLTKENIRYNKGYIYFDIIQQKTKKHVTAPVINPHVIDIIENEFPYKLSTQKLNEYIKEVCKIAEINELIKGKRLNPEADKDKPETIRKILGIYPKHELITTHSFRRSFATNYYKKVFTSVLIKITGHSKESLFLDYINQTEDKDANADLFIQQHEQNIQRPTEPQLRIVKTGTN